MVWLLVLACLLPTNVPLIRTSEPVPLPHIAFRVAHQNGVCSFVLSPNGKILAMGGFESTIKLWDAQHGELLHSLSIPGETAYSLAFSPDSATLASGSDNHVAGAGRVTSSHAILWDTATGKQRTLLGSENGKGDEDRYVEQVAFSPDGTQVAVSTDKRDDIHSGVDLWDAHTGVLLRRTSELPGYHLGLTFSPDGSAFAIGFTDRDAKSVEAKAGIYVWDTGSGVLTHTLFGHGASMLSPKFSPDGSLLASDCTDVTGAGSILIWDARTGEEKRKLVRESTSVQGLVFSPDSKTLASVHIEMHPYQPDFSFSARYKLEASHTDTVIWDLASGKPLHVLPSQWISSFAYSPDGSQLVTKNSYSPFSFDDEKGKKSDQPRHSVLSLWDTKTGALLLTVEVFDSRTRGASLTWIAYTPEGYCDGSPTINEVLRWHVGEDFFPAARYARQYHRLDRIQAALQTK